MPDLLKVALTGDTDLTLTRSFAAPARLVWRAVTEPALITQWMWARVAPMVTCEQDFRVGGAFRWVWRRSDGSDMGVSGKFVEIEAPRRLVHTELFDEDWTDGETVVSQTFTETAPGRTLLTMVIRCQSATGRDKMLASSMTDGMTETYAKLDALLVTLARVAAAK
jgi:uncharacterized protein YndB with AHSA1/START domain